MRKSITLAAAAAALALGAGVAAMSAGPAMAQGCTTGENCTGSVNATVTFAGSETLTLTNTTWTLAATPGSATGTPATVGYTVSSNDASGESVTVQAGAATMVSGTNSFPFSDINVFSPTTENVLLGSPFNEACIMHSNAQPAWQCSYPLSATAAVTTQSSTGIVNGTAFTDSYGFAGSTGSGWLSTGSNAPEVAAGSYTGTLDYVLAPN